MPMSRKRCRAATESVACSEDSTKWPVRAACTAMRAVSTSRISPTRMTSGSWRRIDLSPAAKVIPACSLVWIWLMEGKTYSTGSSMVITLRVGIVDLAEGGVERRGLAAAGRPGAQHHAERGAHDLRECLVGVRRHAELVKLSTERLLSRIRRTHFSPHTVAMVETRTSMSLPSTSVRELTVLCLAPLDDVHARHDLDPADQAAAHGRREHEDFVQGAVDAEPHAHHVLGRLEVDVRSPVPHGLGENSGDDLDDRRVVGDGFSVCGFGALLRAPSTASNADQRSTPPMAR